MFILCVAASNILDRRATAKRMHSSSAASALRSRPIRKSCGHTRRAEVGTPRYFARRDRPHTLTGAAVRDSAVHGRRQTESPGTMGWDPAQYTDNF